MKTKVIGLIGGIAPASTIDYYQSLISGFQKRTGTDEYPPILINSINMITMRDLIIAKQFDQLVDFLSEEIQKLQNGGAEFGALASNTPHIIFNQLKQKCRIPLLSIVEATIAFAKKNEFKKLGLFGTKFTMQSGFYQDGGVKENIEIILPDNVAQDFIHDHYMNEFVKGIFRNEVKNELVQIAQKLKADFNIEGLILGGTEIPLILKPTDLPQIELINTTAVHVESILDYAFGND